MRFIETLKSKLAAIYQKLDEPSGGALRVVAKTMRRFTEDRASQAAASLAYYVFFSLFPLLLVLTSVAGSFLKNATAFRSAVDFVTQAIPVSKDLIEHNLQTVLDKRGTTSLVGLAVTLWSASGAFATLAHNINRAWDQSTSRNFLKKRVVAFAMIGALVSLLLLSLASTTLIRLVPELDIPLIKKGLAIYKTLGWDIIATMVPFLFTSAMFIALYRWIPHTDVTWTAALWSAAVAAVGWELAKGAFAWYLSSGLARYELVYGSLGTVVALLLWIYISALITLFGAHLGATIDHRKEP